MNAAEPHDSFPVKERKTKRQKKEKKEGEHHVLVEVGGFEVRMHCFVCGGFFFVHVFLASVDAESTPEIQAAGGQAELAR